MSESGSKPKRVEESDGGKVKLRNRKTLPSNELKKLTPQQRSRYMAYEEPAKNIADAQIASIARLADLKKQQIRLNVATPAEVRAEKEKHAKLIGQLKAAEARNRLRVMRLRFQSNREQEVDHLIACQPTALNAVRLEALLPKDRDRYNRSDRLDKLDRERCELLIQDAQGLLSRRLP